MAETLHKRVVFSILEYLQTISQSDDIQHSEGAEIAFQCLSQAFCVDIHDASLQQQLQPPKLLTLFDENYVEQPTSSTDTSSSTEQQAPFHRSVQALESCRLKQEEASVEGQAIRDAMLDAMLSSCPAPIRNRFVEQQAPALAWRKYFVHQLPPSLLLLYKKAYNHHRAVSPPAASTISTSEQETRTEQCSNPATAPSNSSSANEHPSPPTASSSHMASASALHVEEVDILHTSAVKAKRAEYVAGLERAGYFRGIVEGSDEYGMRLQQAHAIFDNQVQEQVAFAHAVKQETVKRKSAEDFKVQGNAAMAEKRYTEAVQLYTQAIQVWDSNAIFYANRAAAHLQLGSHVAALHDCQVAIQLDPLYSKAYLRLGQALSGMGQYREAIQRGFGRALELEPASKAILDHLEATQKKLREQQASHADSHQQTSGQSSANPWLNLQNFVGQSSPLFHNFMVPNDAMNQQLSAALSQLQGHQRGFGVPHIQPLQENCPEGLHQSTDLHDLSRRMQSMGGIDNENSEDAHRVMEAIRNSL